MHKPPQTRGLFFYESNNAATSGLRHLVHSPRTPRSAEMERIMSSKIIEPLVPRDDWTGKERKMILRLIWKFTHADYRGITGESWGADKGKRSILIGRRGASVLVLLDDLTAEEINSKLSYINFKLGIRS